MGRFLPVAYGAPGDIAAAGGGVALPSAHLSAVGRGRGRAVGGEPVLPAFLWRDVLSAPLPARPLVADAVAQADRGGGRRVASDQDDRGGPRGRRDLGTERRGGDRRYHGDGEGNRPGATCAGAARSSQRSDT